MQLTILSLWLVLFVFLLPILATGIIILRKTTSVKRVELIFPAGSILGLTIFIFILNTVSFIFKGPTGIVTAYGLVVLLGVLFIKYQDLETEQIIFLKGKQLLFWIITIVGWGGLILWKTSHALIGSDTNLYYAVAHSFLKGNFPPITPWQPDLPLAYHLGTFELLGALHFLTNLSFEFLHLFLSIIFIFCAVQIVFWIWGGTRNLLSFILTNLVLGATFVSFGFFYLIVPDFPPNLPKIENFQQLILWLRNLPTVNQAVEVYGAPVNLDSLIYFIFHAFGLAIFLLLLVVLFYHKKNNQLISYLMMIICLATLSLVDESIFIAAAPALILGIIFVEIRNKTFIKNIIPLFLMAIFLILIALLEGGVISAAFLDKSHIKESIVLFPKKEDIREDFLAYHKYQEQSKILPIDPKWLPFRWYHIGLDILIVVSIIVIAWLKVKWEKRLLLIVLLLSGIFSLLAYHYIVPKYLVANGNRFLLLAFLYFSILISLSFIDYINQIFKDNHLFKRLILIFLILWIFLPTVLPPLTLLSKTRFGENRLIPKSEQSTPAIRWLRDNIPYYQRVMVLDVRTPHPSGVARALVQAGVFSPIFPGDFRAYTIEASRQYLDIAYNLSPKALKKLGIEILLIDSHFYQTLPVIRKQQLNDAKYFKTLFFNQNTDKEWEKIFEIRKEYMDNGNEIDGNLSQLPQMFTFGKVYIDNEENFNPSFLRRAIIFSLRDRDLYYLPQSGVYLNVEANINQKNPDKNLKYDFLVLGSNSNPKNICKCNVDLIWKGLNNEVFLYKVKNF